MKACKCKCNGDYFSVDIVYDNSALNKELTTKVQIDHVITAPHCIIPNCVETSPCHIPVLLARPEKVGKWGCLARNVAITHIVLGSLVGVFHIYFLAVTRYILYFELMVKAQYNTSQTAMKVGLTLAQWQDDSTDIGPTYIAVWDIAFLSTLMTQVHAIDFNLF